MTQSESRSVPSDKQLQELLDAVQLEWGMGGLSDGLYADYAKEVVRRAFALSETGESIGTAWLKDNLTYMKEPLVNARTGEEINGEVRWTVWWTGPDAATFREALDLYRKGAK